MRKSEAGKIALGGMLGALALVIMSLGGLIPVATYVCPAMCTLLCGVVLRMCGRRIAWAWYGCVAILSVLIGPDKEAAAVYLFLGYYPILKPWFDRLKAGWLLKAIYFNAAIAVLYTALIYLFGMTQLLTEYWEFGVLGLLLMLILGNITFFLLDKLLQRMLLKK